MTLAQRPQRSRLSRRKEVNSLSEEHFIAANLGTPLEEARAAGVEAERKCQADQEAHWKKQWAEFVGKVWKLAQAEDLAPRTDSPHSRAIFFKRLGQAILDWLFETDHHQH